MAGKHIASCGCTIPGEGVAVEYHGQDRQGEPCIVYATYCRVCASELVLDPSFIRASVGKSDD